MAFCHLDQILLTFGALSIYYQEIRTEDLANIPGCTAILESIEKQWAKADQEVFIAAVILNPFIKMTAFAPQVDFVTRAGLLKILKRLYIRFFSHMETADNLAENTRILFSNLDDYIDRKGICKDMPQYIDAISDQTRRDGETPDPIVVYDGITPLASTTLPPLFKLAYHILSICPNSASCERLFSAFGNTLTKLRNRLGNQTLTSLAELKMHIRDKHLRAGETKKRMKRFFGNASTVPSTQALAQQPITPVPPLADETESDDAMAIDLPLQQSQDGFADEFNRLTSSFGRQASGDDNDGGDGGMPSEISIKLADLFDFANRDWIGLHERSASRSLAQELELYELLDTDAPGDNDVNVEMDPALDSILHHV